MLLPQRTIRWPLCGDSFNAVFVHGDAVDDAMFYGRGAGELPTASAVVGDVIDVVRNIQYRLHRPDQLYLLSEYSGEAF